MNSQGDDLDDLGDYVAALYPQWPNASHLWRPAMGDTEELIARLENSVRWTGINSDRVDMMQSAAAELRRLSAELDDLRMMLSSERDHHDRTCAQRDRLSAELEQCQVGNRKITATAERIHTHLSREIARLVAELDRYRDALNLIAAGDGHYGMQAGQYKAIARAALEDK